MELIFDFDQQQNITNVRFDGLDGSETVTSVKGALGLLKIRNPIINFADALKCGAYDGVSDEECERMLQSVTCVSALWRRPGEPEETPEEYEMNPLTLLANAVEALSRLNAQCQTQEPEQSERP